MRLGGKVYDNIKLLRFKERVHCLPVRYVRFYESEIFISEQRLKRDKIARVRETVNTDDFYIVVVFKHIVDEVAAYKSGSSGDKNLLHIKTPLLWALSPARSNQVLPYTRQCIHNIPVLRP